MVNLGNACFRPTADVSLQSQQQSFSIAYYLLRHFRHAGFVGDFIGRDNDRAVFPGRSNNMRLTVIFVSVLLFGMVHAAHAQSLDVGGIELRLGQKIDEALQSLSPYQVQYKGGSWIISQKAGSRYQFLGSISATNNTISYISKSFDMDRNERAAETYSRAAKELRRRGGTACATREVEYTDGLIRGFDTQCGPYTLSFFMPSKTSDGTPVIAGVAIYVRGQ